MRGQRRPSQVHAVGRTASQRGFAPLFFRKPLGVVALVFLAGVTLLAIFAPLVGTVDPLHQDLKDLLSGPSLHHILGTDAFGRDVYSRLVYGGRITLLAVLEALVVASILGPILGIAAGYYGRWVDRLLSSVTAVLLAIPVIIVLLAVLSIFTNNMTAGMIALGIMASAPVARVVRGATLAVRNELYVAAAEVSGVRHLVIMFRHILPRLAGPIIVQLSLTAAMAFGLQGGLAFLGLGVTPPAPSWGGGIAEAQAVILRSQWLLVPYGAVLALAILSCGIIGDAARDASVERWSTEGGADRPAEPPRPAETKGAKSVETAANREGALLTVQGLEVSFSQGDSVVRGVSFEVGQGEFVGIVGESGSGKTTTALSVLGLLPGTARILAGKAMFEGVDLFALSPKQFSKVRGSRIALISQNPMLSLDPAFKVGSQLDEVVRRHAKIGRRAARQRSIDLLRRVRLDEPEAVYRKYPHELSGGMAQRVCIALALSASPQLLIADEPTTALDVIVQAEILDLLRTLRDTTGMAVILVTHNLGVLADICDRAIVMRAGEIVEQGPVFEILKSPRHEYVRELLAATPDLLKSAGRPSRGTAAPATSAFEPMARGAGA